MQEINVTMTEYKDEAREARLALYRQTADELVDALVGILTERDQVHPDDLLVERNSTIKYGTRPRPAYSVITPAGGPRVHFYFRDTKNPTRALDLVSCELLCPSTDVVQEFKPRKNQFDLLTIATRLVQVWQEFKVQRQRRLDEQEEAKRQANERMARQVRHRRMGVFLLENLAMYVGVEVRTLSGDLKHYQWQRYLPGLYINHHEIAEPPADHIELVDITVELSAEFSTGIPLSNISQALTQLAEQVPQDVAIRVWGGRQAIILSCTLNYSEAIVVLPALRAALLPLSEFISKN